MIDAGPNGNHTPGDVRDVDVERAAALVAGKHAMYADEPETAALAGPPENAALARPQPRRRA